jgi:periplasmic divalent cation tolerance protein
VSPADQPSIAVVLTTIGADTDAAALARTLVEERLAACVNLVPGITSIYRWKDRIERDSEQQMIIKTSSDRLQALEWRLRQLHPYELPEFIVLAVTGGSDAYLAWVRDSL